MYVATGLNQFKKEDIFEILQQLINDSEKKVKTAAIKTIAEVHDYRFIPQIIEAVQDTNKNLRMAALETLIMFKTPVAIPIVEGFLLDSDPVIRAMAIRLFDAIPDQIEIEKFRKLLSDDNGEVRNNAAIALGLTHSSEAYQLLINRIQHENDEMAIAGISKPWGK